MRVYNFTTKFKEDALNSTKDKLKFMSEYEVKVMGGKVIAAIASTNSMAAAI
jgi:hypothetical protein